MASLDNLLIIGVRDEADDGMTDLEAGMTHYSLNIWMAKQPSGPAVIPVPYRGGYTGGFNNLKVVDRLLVVADGEGLLVYDLTAPSEGYAEFNNVNEVSDAICITWRYAVSCFDKQIQVRSMDDIDTALKDSNFSGEQMDIPYREFQHDGEGDNPLSLLALPFSPQNYALLNNAADKSHLIDPRTGQSQLVEFSTKQDFPYTFQRQQIYHFLLEELSRYTVFTESTFHQFSEESEHQYPNRVYSFDIRGPPTITELDPLVLEGRQILSIVPTQDYQLTLLTDHNSRSYIETFEPHRREILNARELRGRYELGDRLQQIDNDLLIVRHLRNEIVDAATEDSLRLTGAENDIPIPEISSTWTVPQYLYVTKNPAAIR